VFGMRHYTAILYTQMHMKKSARRRRNSQTLRADGKAETKIFAPPQTPFSGRRTAKI